MSASGRDWPRNIVVDSGVLAAAIDADDPDHVWAKSRLTTLRGAFFTCEGCLTEAIHLLANSAPAVERLGRLVARMTVVSFAGDGWVEPLADVVRMGPAMDFADACVVRMVQNRRDSFALTLDTRDFSTYRIPFASPAGNFHAH